MSSAKFHAFIVVIVVVVVVLLQLDDVVCAATTWRVKKSIYTRTGSSAGLSLEEASQPAAEYTCIPDWHCLIGLAEAGRQLNHANAFRMQHMRQRQCRP